MFFGGGDKVSIEIDPGQGPFYPGSPLNVSITLRSKKKVKVSEVRAVLLFHEQYRYKAVEEDDDGDRQTRVYTAHKDWEVHKDLLMGGETIPGGFEQTYQLDWKIPEDAQPPYSGKVIQAKWLIKVTLDRKLRKDINKEIELPIIVPPPGTHGGAGEYGHASHSDKADMQLWLPRVEWVEGETIEGKLKIYAHDNISCNHVRIELTRKEEVFRENGNVFTVTEFKERISGGVKLRSGETSEIPFSVAIPKKGCPTLDTPVGRVTWTLKGILSRRLRKDFTVTQEIFVYNGSKA